MSAVTVNIPAYALPEFWFAVAKHMRNRSVKAAAVEKDDYNAPINLVAASTIGGQRRSPTSLVDDECSSLGDYTGLWISHLRSCLIPTSADTCRITHRLKPPNIRKPLDLWLSLQFYLID